MDHVQAELAVEVGGPEAEQVARLAHAEAVQADQPRPRCPRMAQHVRVRGVVLRVREPAPGARQSFQRRVFAREREALVLDAEMARPLEQRALERRRTPVVAQRVGQHAGELEVPERHVHLLGDAPEIFVRRGETRSCA